MPFENPSETSPAPHVPVSVCSRKSQPDDPGLRHTARFGLFAYAAVSGPALSPGYRRCPPPSTPARSLSGRCTEDRADPAHCPIQPHMVCTLSSTPKRRKIFACRCSGSDRRISPRSPATADSRPPCSSQSAAKACPPSSPCSAQAYFLQTSSITISCAGMYS